MSTITNTLDFDDGLKDFLDSNCYMEYLQAISYFHNYSCRNILLIIKQMPHATKIASYEVWKNQHNRTIIRDSKSIRILSPIPEKPKSTLADKIDPDTGNPILDSGGKKILEEASKPQSPKFKEISVFDVTQTSGKPIQKLVDGIVDDEALSGAFFDSLQAISSSVIDEVRKDNEAYAQTISRLINGLSCAKKSCNLGRNSSIPQFSEKLIQESISYVVCWRFGIILTGLSFDYIADKAAEILPFMGEILDNIRIEASNLIKSLEDSFKQTCEKRGINPVVDYEPNEKKPSKPKLSQSNSHTETP